MTIKTLHGNLFELVKPTPDCIQVIAHGCNAQGKMGSGFAKELRSRFPLAYHQYHHQYISNNNKLNLGDVVYYHCGNNIFIANCITQEFYGRDGKVYVSYDAINDCFTNINTFLTSIDMSAELHFPKIGAVLAGGDWEIISNIIDETIQEQITKTLYIL